MVKKAEKRTRLFKTLAIVVLSVVIFTIFLFFFRHNMVPVVMNTCEAKVRAIGINSINNAASIIITDDLDYDELFSVILDDDNQISMIQARSPKINRLAREMARLTQYNLESVESEEVSIAIGTLTGMTLLIGLGPPVNITINPIGVAYCDFVSEFISAGINQTIHKIYIDVYVKIDVALPIDDLSVTVKSEILICENLIVGKVPDTYLTMGRIVEGLNLVP